MSFSRTRIVTVAAVLFVCAVTPGLAIDPTRPLDEVVRDVWTTDDGLPSGSITALAQSSDGHLWVGTQAGLVRFDGVRFVPVVDDAGRPLASVDSLAVGANGVVWIGTVRGVYRAAPGRVERVGPPDGETWVGPLVFEDRRGRVWLATSEGGPLRLWRDDRFEPFEDDAGRTVKHVSDVKVDGTGRPCFVGDEVWCLGVDGRFDLRLDLDDPVRPQEVVFGAGAMWAALATRGVLEVTDEPFADSGRLYPVNETGLSIFDITLGPHGEPWFGGDDSLGRIVDGRVERVSIETRAEGYRNFVLLFDRDRDLWVGTNGAGLHRYREAAVRTLSSGEGLSSANALAVLHARDGSTWLAREGPGVQRLVDGVLVDYGAADGLPWNVLSLWEGADGTIWVGGVGGVARFTDDGRFDLAGGELGPTLSGFSSREGVIFAGGVRGLFRWNGTSFEEVDWADAWTPVVAISESPEGSLWISAARTGVLERRGGDNRAYRAVKGWPTALSMAILHDDNGDVWIPTYDRGIVRIRGNRFVVIGKEHGLPTESFYHAVDDGRGRLWLSTADGVLVVSFDALRRVAESGEGRLDVRRYGTADGMRATECNGGQSPAGGVDADGRVWFPTVDGFAILDPRTPAEVLPPPTTVIESVRVDGRDETATTRAATGSVAFGPGPGNLEIAYTAPTFRGARDLAFRYRLDGYDDDWVEAGDRRTALYTRVPPGRYTFRVQSGRDGSAWGEAAGGVDLRLRPHFWQTPWFVGAVIAMFAALAWSFHRFRLSRAVEIERMRTRIATDLHDDIGSSLSQVAILSEVVRNRVDGDDQVRSILARIGEVSRGVVDAMSDIVWAIDPERDDLEDVVQRMRRFGNDTLGGKDVAFRLEAPDAARGLRVGPDLRRELYLVFKEAVHNVAKHADARRVHAVLRVEGDVAVLEVRDDGRGIDDANRGDGHGLGSMRRRAERMGGRLTVDGEPAGGTRIRAEIPLRGRPSALPEQVGRGDRAGRTLPRS